MTISFLHGELDNRAGQSLLGLTEGRHPGASQFGDQACGNAQPESEICRMLERQTRNRLDPVFGLWYLRKGKQWLGSCDGGFLDHRAAGQTMELAF